MNYITGIYALNLKCSLKTPGDWQRDKLNWDNPVLYDSENSMWGDYGIEKNFCVPKHHGKQYWVANHIRASLDLLEMNEFTLLQGFRDNFIDNEKFTQEIFDKVYKMRNLPNWEEIKKFIGQEYSIEWYHFLDSKKESLPDYGVSSNVIWLIRGAKHSRYNANHWFRYLRKVVVNGKIGLTADEIQQLLENYQLTMFQKITLKRAVNVGTPMFDYISNLNKPTQLKYYQELLRRQEQWKKTN